MKESIYVQYTNPGGYPPLEHSSDVLLAMGLKTTFLGVVIKSLRGLDFPQVEGREVRLLPWVEPGVRRKLLYLVFLAWTTAVCLWRRPALVYCSDTYSCPTALLLSVLGLNVVYHEHDAPAPDGNRLHRAVLACRRRVLRRVSTLVPSDGRRSLVLHEGARDVHVVWNCPSRVEVSALSGAAASGTYAPLRIVYQGTIVPDRVPPNLVRAMVRDDLKGRVELKIIGYETESGAGLLEALFGIADGSGCPGAVEFLGPLSRHEMLRVGARFDVGLSLMPIESDDANMTTMIGASNKPFDYMAQGLPMICSELADWQETFADHAVFCDPRSVESIAAALTVLLERRSYWSAIGIKGQGVIASRWNYESLFTEHGLPATGIAPVRAEPAG